MLYPATDVFGLLALLLRLLSYAILLDVIVSWAWYLGVRQASPYQPWVRTLRRITDPVLAPIRRLLPPRSLQGLDISPIVAILLLQFLSEFVLTLGR